MRTDQVTSFPAIHLADSPQADTPAELCRRKLKELSNRLDEFHAFGKGQFVKWKSGLKNRKFPDSGEPAIVTAVLPSPVFDPSEVAAASPYFQEPLTLIIGTYRDDASLNSALTAADLSRSKTVGPHSLSGPTSFVLPFPLPCPGRFLQTVGMNLLHPSHVGIPVISRSMRF